MLKRLTTQLFRVWKVSCSKESLCLAMGGKTFLPTWDTGVVVGLGNPLLDISASVDLELFEKYGLLPRNAILAEKKHMPLFDELIKNYSAEYIAGGSVQNSLRVCQWILQKPFSSVYFGSVGKDKFAYLLAEKAREDGVLVKYEYISAAPTGRCAVLINGKKRSLCADRAASNLFTVSHLEDRKNWIYIQDAKYFYTSGYFLATCDMCVMKIAHHAHINDKLLLFNLSAPYVSAFYMEPLLKVLPFIDILFGNHLEMIAFAEVHRWDTKNLKEVGMRLRNLEKANSQRPRIVIMTRGARPIMVFQEGIIQEYDVRPIPPNEIADTNSAGDAFVGGFVAQLIMNKCLDTCIQCGIYAAQYIIRQSGCTVNGKSNFMQ